jgi:hypothetical protein
MGAVAPPASCGPARQLDPRNASTVWVGDGQRQVHDGPSPEGHALFGGFVVAGSGDATTLPWNVGEDHERFLRTADGWRLVSRRWVNLFTRGDVINLP